MTQQPLLIAYDGSPEAAKAIESAAALFPGRTAKVITVWSSILLAPPIAGGIPAYLSDLDPKLEQSATATADKGARLARDAGLDAGPMTMSSTPAWKGIVDAAESVGAELVVVGARGLSGLRSMLLGSTSHGVLHHADRPVLVIPDPERTQSE